MSRCDSKHGLSIAHDFADSELPRVTAVAVGVHDRAHSAQFRLPSDPLPDCTELDLIGHPPVAGLRYRDARCLALCQLEVLRVRDVSVGADAHDQHVEQVVTQEAHKATEVRGLFVRDLHVRGLAVV